MTAVETTTPPASGPVSLEDMKEHLRMDAGVPDGDIAGLIREATAAVETFARIRIMPQEVAITADAFPAGGRPMALPVWPVRSVTSVSYVDGSGVDQIMPQEHWRLVKSSRPRKLAPAYGRIWPTALADYDAVVISVSCGYGPDEASVPPDIVRAVKMMAARLHDQRGEPVSGSIISEIPTPAESLLRPHIFHGC